MSPNLPISCMIGKFFMERLENIVHMHLKIKHLCINFIYTFFVLILILEKSLQKVTIFPKLTLILEEYL